jgi:hypothetical protein
MGFIRLWDPTTGKEIRHLNSGQGGAQVLAFSPDGKYLASGGWDNKVHLWRVSSGREIRTFEGTENYVNSLAFSADGKSLASGNYQGKVFLWEVATGKLRQSLTGHEGQVATLAFAADGRTLVSGSQDTTILVWSITSSPDDDIPTPLKPNDLKRLWTALGDEDVPRAYQAVWDLIGCSERAVPFLKDQLHPVPAADSSRIVRLLGQLDNPRFEVRQKATAELEKFGELATPELRQVLQGRPSPEVRRRAEHLLDLAEAQSLSPEGIRTLRAVEVLERIANPEARQVLQRLGAGAPGATVTQEARTALKRLDKRLLSPAVGATRMPPIWPWGA